MEYDTRQYSLRKFFWLCAVRSRPSWLSQLSLLLYTFVYTKAWMNSARTATIIKVTLESAMSNVDVIRKARY